MRDRAADSEREVARAKQGRLGASRQMKTETQTRQQWKPFRGQNKVRETNVSQLLRQPERKVEEAEQSEVNGC